MASASRLPADVLISEYADDPDIGTILDEFIDGLVAQVEDMRQWLAQAKFSDLQRGAHRIKGSGGGYGYPVLTEAARSLEDAAKARDYPTAAAGMERVAALCQAIQRGRNRAVST